MADGSSGNLGGILFEAGKTISDAGKKQAQQVANSVVGQATGNSKPLFNGQKPQSSGTFTPKPAGGQLPKDPFGGLDGGAFGKMFESGKPGLGAKQSPPPQSMQYSQADLDNMAAQNKMVDDQEIAKRQAELEQIKQGKHKQLHDEVYYDQIRNVGQDSIAQERNENAQIVQQEEEARQQQQAAQQQEVMPGSPLAKNQLGDPIAVTQAKTQTEVNRGTTG